MTIVESVVFFFMLGLSSFFNIPTASQDPQFAWLEMFLSSFLGFLFALLVEAIWNTIKEKKTQKALLKNLSSELKQVSEQVKELISTETYIRPYSIPIWASSKSSGTITCLYHGNHYIPIIEAYSTIEEANLIEMECFKLSANNIPNDLTSLFSVVCKSRVDVATKIQAALKCIEEVS